MQVNIIENHNLQVGKHRYWSRLAFRAYWRRKLLLLREASHETSEFYTGEAELTKRLITEGRLTCRG
jgi:erythromycin esterase-like protein